MLTLYQNLISNLQYLRADFLGISFNPAGIIFYCTNIVIAFIFICIYFLLGEKVRRYFFKEINEFSFFISVALGYIVIGISLGLLGTLSLLYPYVINLYVIVILFISLYPFSFGSVKLLYTYLKKAYDFIRIKNFVLLGVMLFICVALLRLSLPETTEDGYHTDLPSLYLISHTSLLQDKDALHVIPYPQLAEMNYLIPIFYQDKDAARFLHFGFYILSISLLIVISKKKNNLFYTRFSPLLFVTAPLMVRYSTSQYIDFFMVFTFLLSIILLEKMTTRKHVVLSGLMYGAVISIKMWMLIYIPPILFYLILKNKHLKSIKIIGVLLFFLTSCLIIVLL